MLLSCVIFTLVLSDSWDSILENEYDIIKIIRLDMKLLSDEERNDQYIRYNEEWDEKRLSKKNIRYTDNSEFNSAIDHRHLGLYLLS